MERRVEVLRLGLRVGAAVAAHNLSGGTLEVELWCGERGDFRLMIFYWLSHSFIGFPLVFHLNIEKLSSNTMIVCLPLEQQGRCGWAAGEAGVVQWREAGAVRAVDLVRRHVAEQQGDGPGDVGLGGRGRGHAAVGAGGEV